MRGSSTSGAIASATTAGPASRIMTSSPRRLPLAAPLATGHGRERCRGPGHLHPSRPTPRPGANGPAQGVSGHCAGRRFEKFPFREPGVREWPKDATHRRPESWSSLPKEPFDREGLIWQAEEVLVEENGAATTVSSATISLPRCRPKRSSCSTASAPRIRTAGNSVPAKMLRLPAGSSGAAGGRRPRGETRLLHPKSLDTICLP